MLLGLNHLTLAVSKLDRSFNFYTDLLNFTPKAKWNSGAYLVLGELWLCLSLDNQLNLKNDYTHYAFSIEPTQMDRFKEKLKKYKVLEWKENKSEGESLYFLDPDGHKLEVHIGSIENRLASCTKAPYEGMVFF